MRTFFLSYKTQFRIYDLIWIIIAPILGHPRAAHMEFHLTFDRSDSKLKLMKREFR